MPMTRGHSTSADHSPSVNGLSSSRPLHCLSHGKQMPTAEHAGQLPGYVLLEISIYPCMKFYFQIFIFIFLFGGNLRHVDEGDQGVNDAKWLQRESILVTVSGDGRYTPSDANVSYELVITVFFLFAVSRCGTWHSVSPASDICLATLAASTPYDLPRKKFIPFLPIIKLGKLK